MSRDLIGFQSQSAAEQPTVGGNRDLAGIPAMSEEFLNCKANHKISISRRRIHVTELHFITMLSYPESCWYSVSQIPRSIRC